MACNSLSALPRSCSEGVVAGLEKVYIIAYKDLEAINSGTTEVYSASTNGIVNQVGVADSKNFVEIGLLKSTSGLGETLTKDNTKGTSFFTQTFTLVLGDLTTDNQTFIKDVVNQPVAVIYKTRTGKHFVVGLNGQFELQSAEGGTGTAETDLIGHTLTFAGISKSVAPMIDDSLVPSLIA
jgi:hypothetical protein